MPTYLSSPLSVCYLDGLDWNGKITWFVEMNPWLIWVCLSFVSVHSRDAYLQLLSSSYWVFAVIATVIQELAGQLPPHPECNFAGKSMPAWSVVLAFGIVTLMAVHKVVYFRRVSLAEVGQGLWLCVATPVVLGVSGNYSAAQILVGALVGVLVGAAVSAYVWLFWMERIIVLTSAGEEASRAAKSSPSAAKSQRRLFGIWTYQDDRTGFYEDRTRITAELYAGALAAERYYPEVRYAPRAARESASV
jgi:hypothetical protein